MAYIGQITMFACGFAPVDWATCNGQILIISANTSLFVIIGTYYGGDGVRTFQLPDLGGFSPMHWGTGQGLTERVLGELGGSTHVNIDVTQMAAHSHNPGAALPATSQNPGGNTWSSPGQIRPAPDFYASQMVNPLAMNTGLIGSIGGNLPHNNQMPYLCVTVCICLKGEVPPHG